MKNPQCLFRLVRIPVPFDAPKALPKAKSKTPKPEHTLLQTIPMASAKFQNIDSGQYKVVYELNKKYLNNHDTGEPWLHLAKHVKQCWPNPAQLSS